MATPATHLIQTLGLFLVTAIAEIVGCYLPYLWLRKSGSPWLLLPAALSLATFAYLLSLPNIGAGRTYAAYAGIYVLTAVFWMWLMEGETPTRWDVVGATMSVGGMAIILLGQKS